MTTENPPSPQAYAVEIRTTRWDAMLDWYPKVLGARTLVRVVDDRYALLELGGLRIALLGRDGELPDVGRISLALEVDDLARFLAMPGSSGQIARDSEGLDHLRLTDPDGNPIRLFCWPAQPA